MARRIAGAITGNAGQVCVAGSRLLVERSLAEPLAERIGRIFAELGPGATLGRGHDALADHLGAAGGAHRKQSVGRTLDAGATSRHGGKACRGSRRIGGRVLTPTLLTDVTRSVEAVREEVFGPVLTLQTFDSEEEALALAQHPEYGLAAGVHTADLGRALRFVRALEAGTVWGQGAMAARPTS